MSREARRSHSGESSRSATDLPTLSVVVIARNEEDRIGRCLESVFGAVEPFDSEVLVVDSNSADRTVERAAEFPASVFRIPDDDISNPSAGRYVGASFATGEQVLFVDGDIELLDTEWVETASRMVSASPNLAGVGGYLAGNDVGATRIEDADWLNGAALYDADALAEVGGFDPFLRAREDLHLGFELTNAGYRLRRLPTVSGEQVRESAGFREPLRRWRRDFYRGVADGLFRAAKSPGLLAKHVRTLRFPIATAMWLTVGFGSLAVPPAFAVWLAVSLAGVAAMARSEGTERAYNLVANWVLVLVAVALHDWETPPGPEEYPIERVERVESGPRLG